MIDQICPSTKTVPTVGLLLLYFFLSQASSKSSRRFRFIKLRDGVVIATTLRCGSLHFHHSPKFLFIVRNFLAFFPRFWIILQNDACLVKNNCQDIDKKSRKSEKILAQKIKIPSTE